MAENEPVNISRRWFLRGTGAVVGTAVAAPFLPPLPELPPAPVIEEVVDSNPVLISMIRNAASRRLAYDICGVQPMTGPTGMIFAMRAKYGDNANV